MNPPPLVFLFSDTGGGHRSAAQAIIEALPAGVPWEMVDIFRDFAPPPLDRIPDLYPPLARRPKLLGQIFQFSDDPRRLRSILKLIWPYIRPAVNRLIGEHPGGTFVSVHPLINIPLGHALQKAGATNPWVTVVTDLVTTHTTWFCPQASLIVVPTEEARQVGLNCGIAPEHLKVVGLPVAEQFNRREPNPGGIRQRLGWPTQTPAILLMGGGEGMGQLETIATTLDEAGLPVTLVVVAGRNKALRQRLEARQWKTPSRVYGFVQEIPDFMHAADMLLTKAGPGTISEAISAGLPVILYDMLNGPEDGNVRYVVDHGAGVWAPRPEMVVEHVTRWLEHPMERQRAAQACLKLARPRAAGEIADLIMGQIEGIV